MQHLYVRKVNISIRVPSLVSTNYSWNLVFSHNPVNGGMWLCLSTSLTRGVENDNLSGILNYLKEGDRVWRWSAQALHLPRLCLTASWTTGSHLGNAVEGLKSPPKLKTNSTIPSPPPAGEPVTRSDPSSCSGARCVHSFLLHCLSSGLGSGNSHPAALPWVSASPPGTSHHCQNELSKPFCGSLLPTRGPYHILHTARISRLTACRSSRVRLAPARSDPNLRAATSTVSGMTCSFPSSCKAPTPANGQLRHPLLCRALGPKRPWVGTTTPSHAPAASCAHLHLLCYTLVSLRYTRCRQALWLTGP